MNNGRDLNKIEFSTENGINYVKIGSLKWICEESGNCKMDSYINGNKSITLAKDDYIGFAGDIGEKFGISIN